LDDVAGAAGVGMKTAWLNRDSVKTKSRLKPDFILRSLSDIPEKLLS
jgi:FMN phosphatase YigB (HAD superfamily)